jgi:hypothetical protein
MKDVEDWLSEREKKLRKKIMDKKKQKKTQTEEN